MTIKPAFLPEGLISLEQARDEVGADILGTLLVENRLAGICFDPFGHYTPIYPTVWATDAGRQIMDAGVLPFGLAQQVGIMHYRDEDIGVYVDKHALYENVEVVEDDEATNAEDNTSDAGPDQQRRKPMSRADIARAAELLREETLTKSMTRNEQRDWLRQTFSDKSVTEAVCRAVFALVPTKIGAPLKGDKKV